MPSQAAKIERRKISPVPPRLVRVHKSGVEVPAKSRWVVPGHAALVRNSKQEYNDVKDLALRTDTPVMPQVFLYTLLSIAVNRD